MLDSVTVYVGYENDLDDVKEAMKEAVKDVEGVNLSADKSLTFWIEEAGNDILGSKVTMFFSVEAESEPWIKSEAYQRVLKALIKEDIKFPRALPR